MEKREVRAKGLEYLDLATSLLQRARLSNAEAGAWEAADLQWWWRTPRRSDSIDQRFWLDDEGPVAAAVLYQSTKEPVLIVPTSRSVAGCDGHPGDGEGQEGEDRQGDDGGAEIRRLAGCASH
jgi:hypothetical protein